MPYSLNTFKTEINDIKDDLIVSVDRDQEGYYSVEQTDFEKCLIKIISVYRAALGDISSDLLQNRDIVVEAFQFENLKLSLNFHTLREELKKNSIGNGQFFHTDFPLISLVFKNCYFQTFKWEISLSTSLFCLIHFQSCFCDHVSLHTNGFHHVNHSPNFMAGEKTVFKKFVFIGMGSHSGFQKSFIFKDCEFLDTLKADNNCVFYNTVSFVQCSFGRSDNVLNDQIISFNNTEFHNSTEFIGCGFYCSPKFHNAKLHSDTSFQSSKFYDTESNSAVGDYRALKQLTHGLGAEHAYMKFHALEMKSRRNIILPPLWKFWNSKWPEKFSSDFLNDVNGYGQNFWRPWLWLLILTLFFTIIYYFTDGVGCIEPKKAKADLWVQNYCDGESLTQLKASGVYSFQRLWGPLGLVFDSGLLSAKDFYTKCISIIQFILSSIIWFILILQMRRQFKL